MHCSAQGFERKRKLFFLAMIRRGIEELARVQGYAEETPHVMDEVRAAWRCRHGSRAEPIETSRLSPIKPPPMTTDVTPTSHSRKDAHPGARAQGEDAFKPDDRKRSSSAARLVELELEARARWLRERLIRGRMSCPVPVTPSVLPTAANQRPLFPEGPKVRMVATKVCPEIVSVKSSGTCAPGAM